MTSQELRETALRDGPLTEEQKVDNWVRDRLVEDLHFTLAQANHLVAAKVNWHEAEALVSAGCPRQTVMDILG